MPRTKNEVEKTEKVKKATSTVKKATAKKSDNLSKTTAHSSDIKKSQKAATSSKKKGTTKSTVSNKKNTRSKVTTKKMVPSIARKKTVTKKSVPKKDNFANILEYYDLPYRYNETVVKILAQTPKVLFVYWDISDSDRTKYVEKYGEYFFNDTYPVLIVHNKTLNYTQEIEINDFANSWYISISDPRSEYSVELGRRFKEYAIRNPDMKHKEDFNKLLSITSSNNLIMPNDHVLISEIKPQIKYRNVKTNVETYKPISHVFHNHKIVNFYKLYKEIYQVEEDFPVFLNLDNPSSGNPTSTFK